MEKNVEWYKELAINRTLKSLEQGNMKGYYLENRFRATPFVENTYSRGHFSRCW